jgi:hypothetical protein
MAYVVACYNGNTRAPKTLGFTSRERLEDFLDGGTDDAISDGYEVRRDGDVVTFRDGDLEEMLVVSQTDDLSHLRRSRA